MLQVGFGAEEWYDEEMESKAWVYVGRAFSRDRAHRDDDCDTDARRRTFRGIVKACDVFHEYAQPYDRVNQSCIDDGAISCLSCNDWWSGGFLDGVALFEDRSARYRAVVEKPLGAAEADAIYAVVDLPKRSAGSNF